MPAANELIILIVLVLAAWVFVQLVAHARLDVLQSKSTKTPANPTMPPSPTGAPKRIPEVFGDQ